MTCTRCQCDIRYNEAYVTFPPAWAERDCTHQHLQCYLNFRLLEKRPTHCGERPEE